MRWKQGSEAGQAEHGPSNHRHAERDRIRYDLEQRAVGSDTAQDLAARLEERLASLTPEHYEAMLDGVAVAWEQAVSDREVEEVRRRNQRELHELGRLMGNFIGELSKLDEALKVLAAYLSRMRRNASRHWTRRLH
ncbi:MAG: hypothetical protein V3T33_05285 [Myxococcota bacterium]